jgi:hypothetical protein
VQNKSDIQIKNILGFMSDLSIELLLNRRIRILFNYS